MNEETATWIILYSGERRRMLYVNDRSGQLHRVFDEADEVWRRLDVSQLLEELMLDPERDRLVFVAGAEELRALDHSLDAEKRGLAACGWTATSPASPTRWSSTSSRRCCSCP